MSERHQSGDDMIPTADREQPDADSSLWLWQVAGVATALALFAATLFSIPEPFGIFIPIGLMCAMGVAVLSIFAESRRLRQADADWIPNPYLYALGWALLTPLVTTPIYVYRRWRHIGLTTPF